ncbi:Calcium-dependent protein kinase [Heracleum sosnowskyi]|uniref:non-specific serine/threonine protein kinase n=1 Tax=Heracleum sosnowskyi TaxID=360622 RepID=A0AAD8N016_9APIA|nr:Calcium-dependent protein kinase [Heracleum sosnowskyi]
MGNTCVGPSIGKNGFLQSVSAAVWRTRPDEALAAGGNEVENVDRIPVYDVEPESPVQSKPPEQMSIKKVETNEVVKPKKPQMKRVPKNFLLVDKKEDSLLKTIDFGLSIFFKPGETFSDVVGSPYYVAPEVLRKRYGPEADVWSAGVMVYILLSGVPPFWDETEQGIFDQVLHGDLDFSSDPWPSISESAKDLVRKMLVRDPKRRLTAHEVLCHPWVQVDGVAPDKPLDSAVISRIKKFSAMNKLKKMALRVIAESLSEEEIAGLKQMFEMIDTDNSGHITFEELKAGISRIGSNLKESEIYDLMQAADVDKSGTIDYGEFVAATLHLNKVEKEDHLFAAFSYFDKDGSGYITQDELQQACEEFGIEDARLEEMIKEADQDNDGRIDYNEFVTMMHGGNAGHVAKKGLENSFSIKFKEAIKH